MRFEPSRIGVRPFGHVATARTLSRERSKQEEAECGRSARVARPARRSDASSARGSPFGVQSLPMHPSETRHQPADIDLRARAAGPLGGGNNGKGTPCSDLSFVMPISLMSLRQAFGWRTQMLPLRRRVAPCSTAGDATLGTLPATGTGSVRCGGATSVGGSARSAGSVSPSLSRVYSASKSSADMRRAGRPLLVHCNTCAKRLSWGKQGRSCL